MGASCLSVAGPCAEICGECQASYNRYVNSTLPPSTFSTQVGGDHYKDMKIQPTEYILANQMGFAEGNVIKYVSRYKKKNGVQDLKKARHYLDMLIEQEEKNGNAA